MAVLTGDAATRAGDKVASKAMVVLVKCMAAGGLEIRKTVNEESLCNRD